MLCIPIIAQGDILGILHFFDQKNLGWSAEELRLTSAVAQHTSLTLASLELRGQPFANRPFGDALTGLYNRRYLLETMEHELSRGTRHENKLGILMLDLDHLNDLMTNMVMISVILF